MRANELSDDHRAYSCGIQHTMAAVASGSVMEYQDDTVSIGQSPRKTS